MEDLDGMFTIMIIERWGEMHKWLISSGECWGIIIYSQ